MIALTLTKWPFESVKSTSFIVAFTGCCSTGRRVVAMIAIPWTILTIVSQIATFNNIYAYQNILCWVYTSHIDTGSWCTLYYNQLKACTSLPCYFYFPGQKLLAFNFLRFKQFDKYGNLKKNRYLTIANLFRLFFCLVFTLHTIWLI